MNKHHRPAAIESMERRLFLDASSLTVSVAASTLPASVSDESALKGTVTVDVANAAGTDQKFKSKIELLAGATVVASKSVSISLAAGASENFSVPVNFAKGKLADGTYSLSAETIVAGAVASESASGTLVVRPPDVVFSDIEAFRKLPTTVSPDVKFSTTDIVSITNGGTDPSVDPFAIAVYASTDGDDLSGAVLLATAKKKITIKPRGSASISLGIKVPTGLPAGTYQIISTVTQANGTVTTTNPAIAPVLDVPAPATNPEFVDTILGVTPVYINQSSGGQTVSEIDVQMFIENKGVTSDGSSQYALYVSPSPTFDSTATQIVSLPLTQLLPGQDGGKSFQVDFGVPQPNPSVLNGSSEYVYVQVTDPDGDVTLGSDATPVMIK